LPEILLQPTFGLATLLVVAFSAVVATTVARRLRTAWFAVFGLAISAGMVVVAMFLAGRGTIDFDRFDVRLVSGCFDGHTEWIWNTSAYLNLILYAPFAFFAVIITRRPRASILAVASIAFVLELLQNIMDIGVCEEADIVRNIFGVGPGVALGTSASMLYDRARQRRTVTTQGSMPVS
jgi:hypothetical protein